MEHAKSTSAQKTRHTHLFVHSTAQPQPHKLTACHQDATQGEPLTWVIVLVVRSARRVLAVTAQLQPAAVGWQLEPLQLEPLQTRPTAAEWRLQFRAGAAFPLQGLASHSSAVRRNRPSCSLWPVARRSGRSCRPLLARRRRPAATPQSLDIRAARHAATAPSRYRWPCLRLRRRPVAASRRLRGPSAPLQSTTIARAEQRQLHVDVARDAASTAVAGRDGSSGLFWRRTDEKRRLPCSNLHSFVEVQPAVAIGRPS